METVIRIAVIYVFLLFGLRMIGKRELSQLSPRELVMLLLIPELFSQAALGEDFSLVNAMIACATLLMLVFLTSVATHLSRRLGGVVDARPAVLVERGRVVADNLNRERITPQELFSEMRLIGLSRLEEVEWAILEGDGKIAIVPARGGERHPQPHQGELV